MNTDGAPAMLGFEFGFQARVRSVKTSTRHLHWMLHRYALACKTLPHGLQSVLQDLITMVNYSKTGDLNNCMKIWMQNTHIFSFATMFRISKGNVLERFSSMKEEIISFFTMHGKEKTEAFISKLSNCEWQLKLAYLTDIFLELNKLNRSLQEKSTTVINYVDKVKAFNMKLNLWRGKVKDGMFDMFQTISGMGATTPGKHMTKMMQKQV